MREPSRYVTIALFVATLLLTMGLKAEAQTKQTTDTKTLTLGVVFQGPREPLEKHFRPLVDYAARKLTPTAETKGMVVVAIAPALEGRNWRVSQPHFHQQRKRHRTPGRSPRQDHRFRGHRVDLGLFVAQALSAQEGVFRGGKTECRSQGFR